MSNIKIKMTPRSSSIDVPRYSPDELLHLRYSLPVLNCVVNKLNKHPDIGIIFKYISLKPSANSSTYSFYCATS